MTDTEDTTPEVEQAPTRPAKIRTSITIRPDFLEQAKTEGPSVSGVIDRALAAYFNPKALAAYFNPNCKDVDRG